jgi:HSP20 family molecular chaperone IbpA
VHNDRLTISGEKNTDIEGRHAVRERSCGDLLEPYNFLRESRHNHRMKGLSLIADVCRTQPYDRVKAHMEDGILQVTFPKAAREQETKRITIS